MRSHRRARAQPTLDDHSVRLAIDPSVLTAFVILWAAIVPTPGANSLMVTHVALTRGPLHVALR